MTPFVLIGCFVLGLGSAFLAVLAFRRLFASYRDDFTVTAEKQLSNMFLFVDPNRLLWANIAAAALTGVLLWLLRFGLEVAIPSALLVLLLPRFVYGWMWRRHVALFMQQLPDALVMLSGAMRAGAGFSIALESLVRDHDPPLAQEFELVLRQQRVGVPLDEALDHLDARIDEDDLHLLIAGIKISRETGGNLAELLESVGETVRQKQIMQGKIASLTAQGKLQGVVMASLPFLLAALLMQLEPEAMSKLFTTEVGWAVLAVVVVAEALGWFFIRRITTIEV